VAELFDRLKPALTGRHAAEQLLTDGEFSNAPIAK